MALTFYCPMPGATEFSEWATTEVGLVSGYKVRASMFSTVTKAPGVVKKNHHP